MNFIDRYRIGKNPNIIDNDKYFTDERFYYALENGYVFNEEKSYYFSNYEKYVDKFYDEIYESSKHREYYQALAMLGKLYNNDKKRFIEKIVNDKDFQSKFLEDYLSILTNEERINLLYKFDNKKETLSEINTEDILENSELSAYTFTFSPDIVSEKFQNTAFFKKYIEACSEDNFLKLLAGNFKIYQNFDELIKNRLLSLSNDKIIEVLKIEKALKYIDMNIANEYFKKILEKNPELIMSFYSGSDFVIGNNTINIEQLDSSIINNLKKGILNKKILFDEIPIPFGFINELLEASLISNFDLLKNEYYQLDNIILSKSIDEFLNLLRKTNYDISDFKESYPTYYDRFVEKALEEKEEKIFEALKKLNYDFSNISKLEEKLINDGKKFNISIFKESLKLNKMSLFNFKIELDKETYKEIYDSVKDLVSMGEIYKNDFLRNNPNFTLYLIKNGIKEELNLNEVKCDSEEYKNLQLLSINMENVIADKYQETLLKKSENGKIYINLTNIENIREAIDIIKKNNLSQELYIVITPENHNENIISKNLEYFKSLLGDDLKIMFKYSHKLDKSFIEEATTFDLNQVIKDEMFLKLIVDDIESKGLSQFEKFIAVYDIVKNFKPYKNTEDKSVESIEYEKSRALYEYLNNSYFVCVGFADLFHNLCEKLNLPSKIVKYHSKVEGEPGHAYNYINVEDEKYGINGYYTLDPTNENDDYNSFMYNYSKFCMTKDEENKTFNEDLIIDSDVLLLCQDKEKLKTVLDPKSKNDYNLSQMKKELLGFIKELDSEKYVEIVDLDFSKEENVDIMIKYLNSKINNQIDKIKLLNAVFEVKSHVFKNLNMDVDKLEYIDFNLLNEDEEATKYFNDYMADFYKKNSQKTFKEISEVYKESYEIFESIIESYLKSIVFGKSRIIKFETKEDIEKFEACKKILEEENIKFYESKNKNRASILAGFNNEPSADMTLEEYYERLKHENLKLKEMFQPQIDQNIRKVG